MMSRRRLFCLIVGLVFAFGAVLTVAGLISGGVGEYNSQMKLTEFEANIPINNVSNLDIETSLSELKVIKSNDVSSINIVGHNITKDLLEYSTSNNTFKLRYETKNWYQVIYKHSYKKAEGVLEIYIPAKLTLKDIEIKSKGGKSQISYISAENVYINFGDDDGTINDVSCNYAKLINGDGTLTGENITAAQSDLNLDSGKAVMSNFVCDSLAVNNKSSDIDFSGVLNGESAVLSDGGDVVFTFYGEPKDYGFDVLDGDVTVNDGEPPYRKDAQCLLKVRGDMEFKLK